MLDLQKGDLLNISKKLENIDLGLGWDAAIEGRSWDLDASVILINSSNKVVETVYYGHKHGIGIRLNGDNLTGDGDGDDEIISIKLSRIPDEVVKIGFFVNIFSAGGRDFSRVKNAYIRMVNKDNKDEICRYKLNESGKGYNAFHFANLERVNGEWEFKAIGEGTNGSARELEMYLIRSINTKKKKGLLSKLFK